MTVIVLCDRGISSPKLWTADPRPGLASLYALPPKNITFCADGGTPIACATLRCPSRHRLDWSWDRLQLASTAKRRCTLLAVWYAEQKEPWIILTDLAAGARSG